MGMTIEDTINTFQHIRNHPKTDEEEVIKFGQELFDTAIDTMRKYQKIVEIVKEWREVGLDYDSCDAMDNIERVIEDGKID